MGSRQQDAVEHDLVDQLPPQAGRCWWNVANPDVDSFLDERKTLGGFWKVQALDLYFWMTDAEHRNDAAHPRVAQHGERHVPDAQRPGSSASDALGMLQRAVQVTQHAARVR